MVDDPNDPHRTATSPSKSSSDSQGREPKRRRLLEPLDRSPPILQREHRGTPGSESDYGSDPFEGLTTEQLDTLTKALQTKGSATRNARIPEREHRGAPGSESEYDSDPFEGLTTEELDNLTKAVQSKGTASKNARVHRHEYLRPKLKTLQDEIFHTLFPENGFDFNPNSVGLASASDRFHAVTEILHVRAREFEHHIVSVVNAMPPGLEQMKSIQKLSLAFGNFSVGTQGDLSTIAGNCLWKDTSKFNDEMVQAQKFLTIARDHLDWDKQLDHEAFSKSKENRPLVQAAENELMEEFAVETRERSSIDDQLAQDDFGAIVDRVERDRGSLRHISELTKGQAFELRQFAYALRRIMERLDYTKSLTENDAIDSESRAPLKGRGKSQAADETIEVRTGGNLIKEHKTGLNSLLRHNRQESSSTRLRKELKDRDPGRGRSTRD